MTKREVCANCGDLRGRGRNNNIIIDLLPLSKCRELSDGSYNETMVVLRIVLARTPTCYSNCQVFEPCH